MENLRKDNLSSDILLARAPTHWACPHHGGQEFIPPGESIKTILSRPGKTLAGLRDNNFDGIAFYGSSGVGYVLHKLKLNLIPKSSDSYPYRSTIINSSFYPFPRKTQVAIRLIERYRRHTYDVFWVDASTPTTLAKDFQHISDLLKNSVSGDAGAHINFPNWTSRDTLLSTDKRLPVPEGSADKTATVESTTGSTAARGISSQEDLLLAVKSELESPSTGSWLLILDNLTEQTAIAKFLPRSSNGVIIVTTKSLHLASGLGCQVVEVPRMSPANAVLLFERKYSNPEEPVKQDEAVELMELLEYLPARIVDAALHLSENRVSVGEYIAELKAARRLGEMSSRPWRRFEPDGIYECWNWTVVVAWFCLTLFSVLCAWAIGFIRG